MQKEHVTFNFLWEEHAKCHNLYLLQDDETAGKWGGYRDDIKTYSEQLAFFAEHQAARQHSNDCGNLLSHLKPRCVNKTAQTWKTHACEINILFKRMAHWKKKKRRTERELTAANTARHVFTKEKNKLQNNPPLQVINTRRSLKRNIPGTTTTSHERMAPPETSDGNVVVYETPNVHYMTQPKICVYNMYIIIYIWCLIYGLNLVHNLRLARCGSSFGNFNSSIKITGSFVQQLKTTREWG